MLTLFVYGTLKPGHGNYQRYCAGKVLQEIPAIAQGQLFALPVGYPAMTVGGGWVKGWWLSFADGSVLRLLDELEGYDPDRPVGANEYERREIPVFTPQQTPLGRGWTYFMRSAQIGQMQGVWLPQGEWP